VTTTCNSNEILIIIEKINYRFPDQKYLKYIIACKNIRISKMY